jgi:hypothetical protein
MQIDTIQIKPEEQTKAAFKNALTHMQQGNADLASIKEPIKQLLTRAIELTKQTEGLRLTDPNSAQIPTNLDELNQITKQLKEKIEQGERDLAQEFTGQMDEEELLPQLSGKISDEEQREDTAEANAAEEKCQEDAMTMPMLVVGALIVAQVSYILRGEQGEPGHDATPLSQMSHEERINLLKDDCSSALYSAGQTKAEIDKRQPLVQSAMNIISAIDKEIRANGKSGSAKALIDQLVDTTKQFPAYAQDIVIFVAASFSTGSEAQVLFDAIKDELGTDLSDLEDKTKQATDAAQDAMADASFTASVLRLLRHVAIQLQQNMKSAAK